MFKKWFIKAAIIGKGFIRGKTPWDIGQQASDEAQLPPSGPRIFVLVLVPDPAREVRRQQHHDDSNKQPYLVSSAIYFACTSMTCSVVGFSVFVTCIGRPTGQSSEMNPLFGWMTCNNSQTDTIVRL